MNRAKLKSPHLCHIIMSQVHNSLLISIQAILVICSEPHTTQSSSLLLLHDELNKQVIRGRWSVGWEAERANPASPPNQPVSLYLYVLGRQASNVCSLVQFVVCGAFTFLIWTEKRNTDCKTASEQIVLWAFLPLPEHTVQMFFLLAAYYAMRLNLGTVWQLWEKQCCEIVFT